MSILWSRKFFPKVFGGVFFIAISCSPAKPDDSVEAINAASRAAFIATGLRDYTKDIQKEYTKRLWRRVKLWGIENEVLLAGASAVIARDKRVSFNFKGTNVSLGINSVYIKREF